MERKDFLKTMALLPFGVVMKVIPLPKDSDVKVGLNILSAKEPSVFILFVHS